jgi:hypothetical protein
MAFWNFSYAFCFYRNPKTQILVVARAINRRPRRTPRPHDPTRCGGVRPVLTLSAHAPHPTSPPLSPHTPTRTHFCHLRCPTCSMHPSISSDELGHLPPSSYACGSAAVLQAPPWIPSSCSTARPPRLPRETPISCPSPQQPRPASSMWWNISSTAAGGEASRGRNGVFSVGDRGIGGRSILAGERQQERRPE